MFRAAFPRLRRSLPLLLLALCAWALMVGAAWAKVDCCGALPAAGHVAGMGAMASPAHHHAGPADHAGQVTPGDADHCPCTHACVAMLRVASVPVPAHDFAAASPASLRSRDAPQPVAKPPLRPPLS